MISPSFTCPVRAAFPLGATVSTYTFPVSSSSLRINPRGLLSSTMLSPVLADLDCLAHRMKSSSSSAIAKLVVFLTDTEVDGANALHVRNDDAANNAARIGVKDFIVCMCATVYQFVKRSLEGRDPEGVPVYVSP
mmetsp:Transcript_26993/g.60668  ORF Transcript_26993/g.60668 Transcript_26993/m.60668 type:complete len:135 (-) Transcript_26993:82-486(-)